jgi:ectoine hydroxylase-related dioxygenase (phytanoyl-CoA dioxygenase family)
VIDAADLRADRCDVDDLAAVVEVVTRAEDHPRARRIEQGVPVYDAEELRRAGDDLAGGLAVRTELAGALQGGPGIVVVTSAVEPDVVERATEAFRAMIAEQRAGAGPAGDHFAAPGANDRVWNALQKLATASPTTFVDYYASETIHTVATAWLGPAYQVTSQVNVVRPGGEAQSPHRDYHLGFLSDEIVAQYPAHVHRLSPLLTLQGAIAHCDMSVESGPTMYLPHSQKYGPGYLAWRRPDFIEYFAAHHVQLPLTVGDAVFFNPAVFHAAGTNRTEDVERMANLLQISSAFGRAMETVDRRAMIEAVYPQLRERMSAGMSRLLVDNVIAATADGYPFPTNLDRDQPVDGLTPPSEADILRAAVDHAWTSARLAVELDAYDQRHAT